MGVLGGKLPFLSFCFVQVFMPGNLLSMLVRFDLRIQGKSHKLLGRVSVPLRCWFGCFDLFYCFVFIYASWFVGRFVYCFLSTSGALNYFCTFVTLF